MRVTTLPDLRSRTTLGLGGTCAAELAVESVSEAGAVRDAVCGYGLPVYVLGAGSNLLGLDGRHELLLLRPAIKDGPAPADPSGWPGARDVLGELAERRGRETALVRAGAGTPLPALLSYCREQGLSGLEGLAGIPGSVGGAVAMNAGSFGDETAAALAGVLVLHEGEALRVARGQTVAGYRHFSIPSLAGGSVPPVVAGAAFALVRDEPAAVAARMREHFQVKKSRQPIASRSAGCVFRNPPEGPPAGVLLDRAGFRGRERGGCALSPMHANFLVNTGTGTSADALALLEEARDAVRARFGVTLEYEVRMVPCRSC